MNREIKFRQPIRNKNGEFVEWFYWGIFITPAIQQNGLDTRSESQQFTGRKDLDDKEIYEGDICEYEDSDRVFESIYLNKGVIEYSEWGFSLTNRNEVDMIDIEGSDILVIGNIYENPELLK